eukprot:scaffold198164_cov18-Tisochrysis_lutea.AAC.3
MLHEVTLHVTSHNQHLTPLAPLCMHCGAAAGRSCAADSLLTLLVSLCMQCGGAAESSFAADWADALWRQTPFEWVVITCSGEADLVSLVSLPWCPLSPVKWHLYIGCLALRWCSHKSSQGSSLSRVRGGHVLCWEYHAVVGSFTLGWVMIMGVHVVGRHGRICPSEHSRL